MRPRPKYFAMMHSDIITEPGWLDVLVSILDGDAETRGCDVVSCVAPIRNATGLTSTGLCVRGQVEELTGGGGRRVLGPNPARLAYRRLTMREAFARAVPAGREPLPPTFGAADVTRMWGEGDAVALLTNTGLFACRFDDWAEKVAVRQQDRITRAPDGSFEAEFWPVDFDFAEQCAALGLRVRATTRVPLAHGDERSRYGVVWGAQSDEWHARPGFPIAGP
jgi:hypothetical protein